MKKTFRVFCLARKKAHINSLVMKKETAGTILAIITAIISGFSIPLNKLFVVNLDPSVFTAVRALIIGIVFFFLAIYQNKFDLKNFKKVSWKYLLAIGIIGGAFAFLLFFTGLKLTTAGRSAFLQKTLPFYITILAFIFLKEKINKKLFYSLIAMLAGTCLIYFTQINPAGLWLNPSLGDLLIIGATILWAIENTISKAAMIKGETNFVVSFARMFIGAIVLFGVVLFSDKFGLLLSLSLNQWFNIGISTTILFGYVFCWYWSVKLINVSKASALLLLAPVISLVFGVIVFSEPVPLLQIAGSALILIGAYFVTRVKSELTIGV